MTMTLKSRAIIRSRSAFAAAGAMFAIAVVGTTTAFANHDANVIHACQRTQTGAVRLVASPADRQNTEIAVEWGKQGPAGPIGPMGPVRRATRCGCPGR